MADIHAVVVAAGNSTRMGSNINKQLIELAGRPVLVRSLDALGEIPGITGITVVAAPGEVEVYCGLIRQWCCSPVTAVVSGGATRQESVYNGLQAVPVDAALILIHDGARPLVGPGHVRDVIEAASRWGAAVLAVPVKDTVKVSDEKGIVKGTVPRENLWLIQTPQVFSRSVIIQAHSWARERGFAGTDDASLVEAMGLPVKLVPGAYSNIKITTPEDVAVAGALLDRG